MWRNRSIFKGSSAFDITLIALFCILVYIFFNRRSYISHIDGLGAKTPEIAPQFNLDKAQQASGKAKQDMDEDKITEKVKHIPDAQNPDCKSQQVDPNVKASLILDFFDYSFYDLKLTFESVQRFTKSSFVQEIIIVDDGTTLDYILKDVKSFVSKFPEIILLRNEERQGQAAARVRAAEQAKGSYLIFLDPTVVVSPGWIEPLLLYLKQEKQVVALPHHDKINDPVTYEFIKIHMNTASSFTWALETKMTTVDREEKKDIQPFSSATARGNVFAISKDYFVEIGGLDVGLSEGGGDSLEFSIRTWLCGGQIKVIPCSRVAILNLDENVKINSNRNKWRLIQLWMKDFEKVIHGNIGRNPFHSISQSDIKSLEKRQKELSKLNCKPMTWYVDNIAKDVYVPPSNAKHTGVLKIQNGHCAHVGEDSRIDLSSCVPDHHKLLMRDMTFSLTTDGQFKWGSMCLSVQDSAYIMAEPCQENRDNQKWTYKDEKFLVNKWSGFCMTHVTDPDPKKAEDKRQIAMAQKCDSDTSESKEFSSWTFVKV